MEFLSLRRKVPSGKEQGVMTGFEGKGLFNPLQKIFYGKLSRFFMCHK